MPLTGLYPDFLLSTGSGTVQVPYYINGIQATYIPVNQINATYELVSDHNSQYQLVKEQNG